MTPSPAPKPEAEAGLYRVATALERLIDRHIALVQSGDCGFWNPEDEPEIKEARAALAQAGGGRHE